MLLLYQVLKNSGKVCIGVNYQNEVKNREPRIDSQTDNTLQDSLRFVKT